MNTHKASSDFSPLSQKVSAVREFVERFLAHIGFEGDQHDIHLAVEEAYVNIQKHGLKGVPDGKVTIMLGFENGWLEIVIRDNGPEFDPLAFKSPTPSGDIESMVPGGLGIHLIKKLMDETSYQRIDNFNIFSISKRLEQVRKSNGSEV